MRKHLIYLLFPILTLCCGTREATAQKQGVGHPTREQVRKDYAAYVTSRLGLTETEAAALIPLLNECDRKRFKLWQCVGRARRILSDKTKPTEEEYSAYLDLILDTRVKDANIEKAYYEQYKKVVPAAKLAKLPRVSRIFWGRFIDRH